MFAQDLLPGSHPGLGLFGMSAAVGFAAALPIGPVSILTMQRAMALGFWRAFWPTLGAVMAGGMFGTLAAFGSGYISSFVLGNSFWLKLTGCILMLAMGTKLLTLRPVDRTVPADDFGPLKLSLLNFTLVLTNPLTLAFFLAAFTLAGFDVGRHLLNQSMVVGAGAAFGTLIWFALICGVAAALHMRVGDAFLNRARTGVGGLFIAIAILSAASLLLAG